MRRTLVALLAVTAAACSAASTTVSDSTTGTTAPETTVAVTTTTMLSPAQLAQAYTEPGPYPVGVTTLTLAKGNQVEVWYPAATAGNGTVSYDVRDFTPPAIKAILTGDVSASYSINATRDGDPADGQFPVALFSHGFTGIRLQSTFLTSHLAGWGMIVIAPDHPSRDLFNVLSDTASGDQADAVDDLLRSLDLLLTDPRLGPHADAEHVAAIGHSAGGGTVIGAAADPRVDGYVSLASGHLGADPLPSKPSLFVAGTNDGVVSPTDVSFAAFEEAPTPTTYWQIDGVGHNGFDDFCTFGNGSGIIGVAEASGLGAILDAQPQLRKLGQDGCLPPNVAVTETFPIIRQVVTAWLRNLFGIDREPVGLDRAAGLTYGVTVKVDRRGE
jgi:dienelactone hydrolase